MDTMLFTGAGASRAIGYPLTSELLPRIRAELKSGKLFEEINSPQKNAHDRKDLQTFLLKLLPGFKRASDRDLPLITDIFSLVEYSLLSGDALSIGGDKELRTCRDLLKQAMMDIILGDFLTDWDIDNENQKLEKDVLINLTRWIRHQGKKIGLVTTNYDIGIEYELYNRQILRELDLGFDWRDVDSGKMHMRPTKPGLRVYKLHGSMDLLKCPLCGHVYFNPGGSIVHQAFKEALTDHNTCHCGKEDIRLSLHIVSPSLVRDVRDANLLSIWRSALELMRTANRWIIVGYSLPPEDLAIRSLFLRAYAAAPSKKKPRITVVQKGDADLPKYRMVFPDCTFVTDGLEGFLRRDG